MDVLTVVDDGNKKGDKHAFCVEFVVNPKAIFDKEISPETVVDKLLAEAKSTIVEHLEYLVNGQLSALDATRQ